MQVKIQNHSGHAQRSILLNLRDIKAKTENADKLTADAAQRLTGLL